MAIETPTREAVVRAVEEHLAGNVILTLNGMGTMQESVDPFSQLFVDDAVKNNRWVMDVGCAYGVHTLAAITGGARVIAVDLDERHLQFLHGMLPDYLRPNVRICPGRFPDIVPPVAEPLGAILASRVLHFCDGPTIERKVARMFQLLAPGGRAYALSLTPYVGQLLQFQPVYIARQQRGDPWPGLVEDLSLYDPKNVKAGRLPSLMHFLDPFVLRRVFAQAGFEVEYADFLSDKEPHWTGLKSRPLVGIIARKPDNSQH